MAAEKVGLIGFLDLTAFNRNYNQYISKMGIMDATTNKTAKSLSGSFLGLGKSLLKVAAILAGAVAIGAGLAAVALGKLLVTSVKESAELEQGLANIASVLNITTKEVGFLKGVIVDLGLDPKLKVTTFEAAEAIELLAKSGIFAGMSIREMEQTARDAGTAVVLLANATGADFGQAAAIAVDAMVLFNEDAADMVDIVSSITSVTTNSKFTIDDYELALRNGGASVAMFGVSLKDFNTLIAISAEELGIGRKAGTSYMNFMNRLTPNTEKATQAMKDLGLMTADGTNRFFDATGELKDMSEIAQMLNQSLFGTQQVISEVSNRTAEQESLLRDLNGEYSDAKQTIDDYENGVAGLLATEDEKNKAISEAQSIIDKLSPKMEELTAIDSEYVTVLQTLTTEQRAVALETIFGNDAQKAAIALSKEGALVTSDLTGVIDAFGVSHSEAARMIEDGLTQYELFQQQMSKTDAVNAAATRMDTLKGKIEILSGVMEGLRLKVGEPFIEMLSDLGDRTLEWWEANKDKLIPMFENAAKAISDFVGAIADGEGVFDSFTTLLSDLGRGDLSQKLQDTAQAIQDFIDPIREFVSDHAAEFEGALKAIGVVLAGSMAAALISGVAGALLALLNPVTLLIVAASLLGAAWETNFGNIQGLAETLKLDFERLKKVAESIFDAFSKKGAAGGIKELGNQFGNLEKIAGNVLKKIADFIDNAFGTSLVDGIFQAKKGFAELGETMAPAFAFIKTFVDNVAPAFSEIWRAIVENMGAFAPVLEPLLGLLHRLAPALGLIIVALAGFAVGVINFAAAGIEPFIQGLAKMLEGVLNFVNGTIDLYVGLFNFLKGIFTGDTKLIEDSWNNMVEAIVTITVGLIQTVDGLWNIFVVSIVEGVSAMVQSVIQFFTDLYVELVGSSIIPDMVNAIIEWFVTLDDRVVALVIQLVTDTIKWFADMRGKILIGIAEFILLMIVKFKELFEKIKKVITEKVLEIIAKFKKLTEAIKAIFDNFNWFGMGQGIMDGLIAGITDKLAAAKAILLGVATSLQDAWNDFWSTHSPSRVMFESGLNIMEGATLGVLEGAKTLTSAMGLAGSSALGGFSESASAIIPNNGAQSGGSVTTNSTTQNFNVSNDFAGSPQITDVDQLKLALAGFS